MKWLYLDESGDLGFDFVTKRPSKYFTICILMVHNKDSVKKLEKAVKKTIKNKLRKPKNETSFVLKGSKTSLDVKRYFYKQVCELDFNIYSITLNKRRVYDYLTNSKHRLYNYVSRLLIDEVPLENATTNIRFILDKCKSKTEIRQFNSYILNQIEGRIDPTIHLRIEHLSDTNEKLLQAADLFPWGIFRRYERNDSEWYNIFKSKIAFNTCYLK